MSFGHGKSTNFHSDAGQSFSQLDLSEYQNRLASRRGEVSLFLRRITQPGMKIPTSKSAFISGKFIQNGHDPGEFNAHKHLLINSFRSHDPAQVLSSCEMISQLDDKTIGQLSLDDDFVDSLIEAVNNLDELPLKTKILLIRILDSVISNSQETTICKFIEEVGITLSSILNSSIDEIDSETEGENLPLLPLTIKLFQVICVNASYGRSAMISFGILDSILILMSKKIDDDAVLIHCLLLIRSIIRKGSQTMKKSSSFSVSRSSTMTTEKKRISQSGSVSSFSQAIANGCSPIGSVNQSTLYLSNADSEFDVGDIECIIDPLCEILFQRGDALFHFMKDNPTCSIESVIESNPPFIPILVILEIFVDLTNRLPTLIDKLFKKGLFQFAMTTLSFPELLSPSLSLLGNLPVFDSFSYTETMLENGLFDKLMELIPNPNFASDVYWTLSNLLNRAPKCVIPLIGPEFIQQTISFGEETPFTIKKEIVYFLALLITNCSREMLESCLINEPIILLISDILDSSEPNLILMCISAFQKIMTTAGNVNSKTCNTALVLQYFDSCDIPAQLEDIIEQNDKQNSLLYSAALKLQSNIRLAMHLLSR